MKIIKDKKTGIRTLCLSYNEWHNLIKNSIKDLQISFSDYIEILDCVVNDVLDYMESKGCEEIRFTTRDGEILNGMDYNDLEFEVKYELDYILDNNYLRGNYEKESE
jgi:hypothetical protein